MNAFFPVGSVGVDATASSSTTLLPLGGTLIRIARETSALRVLIQFGGTTITADPNTAMELVSGIVEELENPNPNLYTHFAVVTLSGTVGVNVSCGPRYD